MLYSSIKATEATFMGLMGQFLPRVWSCVQAVFKKLQWVQIRITDQVYLIAAQIGCWREQGRTHLGEMCVA